MGNINRVAVFCASSPGVDKAYFNMAERLAMEMVKNNVAVNYGGGAVGLMGRIADTMLQNGGSIKGYIPVFMKEMQWAHSEVKDMVLVRDMHERKYRILKDVDAVIALPGGVGTMDELMEVITLKQLGQFTKPVIIVNTNNFYNPLFSLLNKMVAEKFMRDIHQNIWTIVNEPEEIMEAIRQSPPWDAGALKFAAFEKH